MSHYSVTVFLEVLDPEAVRAAGVRYLIEEALLSEADAKAELVGDEGIEKSLRFLIDPGSNIDGIEIQDSTCEVLS
jgi:hypothetical protein